MAMERPSSTNPQKFDAAEKMDSKESAVALSEHVCTVRADG